MEKNLLPIAVANNRPNSQVQSYHNFDTQFKNCFFEVYEDSQTETTKVYCIKRAGVDDSNAWSAGTFPNGHTVGAGLGCFTAQPHTSTKVYFAVYGASSGLAHLYYFDGTTVTGFGSHAVPTYKRINYMDVGLPDDTYTVGWTAGTTLYLVKDAGVISNSTPHGGSADLTRPVYMNNRVFVGDRVTGNIIQSNAGVYQTYTASEYLVVESYGGKLVDLGRYNNFIVAFKEFSMEFFEDVANQNGTVLGRVGHMEQQVGCTHPNTIVDTGAGELMWLATDRSGHRSIKMLKNSFEVTSIEDNAVSKALRLTANYDGSYAYMCNVHGHQFYVLTLKQTYLDNANTNDFANCTYAYDLKTKLWSLWSTDAEAGFFTDSATGAVIATQGRWNYSGACKNTYNTTYVQNYDTGALHVMDDFYTNDGGVDFTYLIRITGVDFGTNKRKFLNRLTVYCDGGNQQEPEFTLYIGRDDRNYGSMYGRSLLKTPSGSTMEYSYTSLALGSGRRFNFMLTSTSAYPIRMSAINIDYDIGEGHGIS